MIGWLRHRLRRNDDGVAMVVVLGVMLVVSILAVSAVAYTVGTTKRARADQEWNAALAAAYAGIEEYQSRLANDPGYFAVGNPAAKFSSTSTVHLPETTGGEVNPAFSLTGWADVPGSGGASQFRYEIDNSGYYTDGAIKIRATGRAGGETRSIVADLRQKGFIDFLYFTDFEMQDPQFVAAGTNCLDATGKPKYAHGTNARPTTGCNEIAFGSADTLNGPVHSNDIIRACQTKFNGPVTSSWVTTGNRYRQVNSNNSSCSAATFVAPATGPAYQATLGMPPTNSSLKKETRSDIPAEVPRPGCLYTGPTSITFNADGTMTIISPWTQYTSGNSPTKVNNPGCGTPGPTGLGKVASGKYVGETIAVPASNVLYVQNVPSLATDPNYASPSTNALKPVLPAPPLTGAIACANATSNNIGYPMSGENTPKFSTASNPAYGCRNGDVFVKGTLHGKATIAAENYVYATGDITYKDEEQDILGLVGNNAVWIWNPMNSSNQPLLTAKNRTVSAAVLSVAHTIAVQNYGVGGGDRGVLTIKGAMAQKFRGVVISGGHGYGKNYVYDQRFKYTAPPKFLSPVTTTYGVSVWAEVKPAFDENGTYR